jgi:pimeloyl-ACP methyl ester carboxylesterase
MRIRNGSHELNVVEDGNPDGPPLVLLHGITSSTASWDWLVPHVDADHRVLRLDFRGHGGSDRTPGEYDMPAYVSDAEALCEYVGAPCTIVGHSLGGGTAAALAQRRPDLVRAIVLEDPPLFTTETLREENSLMDAFRLMRQTIPMLQEQKIPHDALVDAVGATPSSSGQPMSEVLQPDAMAGMATSLMQLDATVLDPVIEGRIVKAFDANAPIPVPTLILAADPASPDAVVTAADIEQLARVSPHVEVRVVRGASHLIHDELANRQVFLDAVLDFLKANVPA